jgi:hypothetical protein
MPLLMAVVHHRPVGPAGPPHALPDHDWVSENVALVMLAPATPEMSIWNSERTVDTPSNAW